MKPRYLFFGVFIGLTLLSMVSWSQAPVVTTNNKKDACLDQLDGGGNPGTDGILDNGSINVTVTSGIPPISLFILGPVNKLNIPMTLGVPYLADNLKPGVYNVIVQDGNPSDFAGSFVVNGTTDITLGLTAGFPINSTSCGTPNGQIAIDVSGGTGGYVYSWTATNGFTSSAQDITGLTAGDYTVVVSDNGTNCSQTIGPISIIEPPAPTNAILSLTGTTPICSGKSSTFKVDVTGGVGPFTLAITGLGVVNNYISGADITVSPLANTTYTLTNVTDINGCISVAASGSTTINVNPVPVAPAVTFVPNTYCVNNAIVAPSITTPTGGSTYNWYADAGLTTLLIAGTNPTNVQLGFNSVAANTTTVFVAEKNSSNCEGAATSVTLTVNAIPAAPAVTFAPSSYCIGQAITPPVIAAPVGGSTYSWYSDISLSTLLTTGIAPTNAQLGFSSALANTTTVYARETNSNNCPGPATPVTLTVTAIPTLPGITFSPGSYCVGAAITPPIVTTPVVGSTYTWYSDAGLTTILTTGSSPTNAQLSFSSAAVNTTVVFVTETNSSNCTGLATTVTLTVNPNPLAPAITFSPSSYCVGQPITPPVVTTPIGGSTYSWYSDVSLSTLLTTGTAPTNAQLGFSSAGANTTTVFVTETSSSNCPGPATSITLTVSPVPVAPAVTFSPGSYCVGSAITPPVITTPTGGSTYTWYSDAGLTTVLTTGTLPTNAQLGFSSVAASVTFVFVTETTSNNCTGPATTVTLTVNAVPSAPAITFSPSTYCVGQAITPPVVTVPVGGSTYSWYSDISLSTLITTGSAPTNAQLGFSSVAANSTTVFVTEMNSSLCPGPATAITLTVNPKPLAPSITFNPTTYCVGTSIIPPAVTTPNVGSVYTWYGDASLTILLTTGNNPTNVQLGFSSAVANTKTIFVTEKNSTNCEGLATPITLTVNAVPVTPTITFTPNKYCVGGIITPPVVTTPNVGSVYTWYGDVSLTTILTTGTTPTNAQLGFSSAAANVTTVFVTETFNGCESSAAFITLTVNNLATAEITGSTTICNGQNTNLNFNFTGTGPWNFQYSDGVTTFPGSSVASSASISVSPTTTTTYTLISVTDANCPGTLIGSSASINVDAVPLVGLAVTTSISPVCSGGSSDVEVANSELGVSYQLRNNADNSLIGSALIGTGATLVLPTGALASTITFNVLATRGVCAPVQLTATVTITVVGSIDASVNLSPQAPAVCSGSSTNIQISNSESGVNYQLRNDADDSLIGAPVAGTGASINLPTGNLILTSTFNILASNGTCSIELTNLATVNVDVNPNPALVVTGPGSTLCVGGSTTIDIANSEVGVSYQLRNDADDSLIGSAMMGTGSTLLLSTGVLNTPITFNVLATGGVCAPVELTSTVLVNVAGAINLGLAVTAQSSTFCAGTGTVVQIANSEVGVDYQLRDDSDNSSIGALVAGTGGTLDLPTGNLLTSITLNVLASTVTCAAPLAATVSITVNPAPAVGLTVTALSGVICFGTTTAIQVDNSEVGVSYQLRDNVTNITIGGALVGTGSILSLPTGALTSNSTFNVFATIGSCSNQLTAVVSVSVLPSGDPSCAPLNNCATVVITPVTTMATCGAAVPDGTVTFDIIPAVPVVNLIGVKIQIDGPLQATQFNNFKFTGLPAGIYNYTVTYGDDTNPACIKIGLFTIDPTGVPDLVDFDIISSTYDCLVNSGSVVLSGFTGSANTDYTFMVFDNGNVVLDGAITKDQAASGAFTFTGLALGSYQIQLSQNQSGVNGCVGSVTSIFYDLAMAEPAGGCGLFVPNVFTPNGDGANDLLVIRNLPANSKLIINNRWGKEVFSASDYKNDWTGGDIADGIYYYLLSADGQAYKGWIEILRGR
ncbi:MAG: gliding motility-associated C-terminal domain-containing protein [Cyclobacteriaceae bacterium]|nr:gliding motility-associated C-terminal domain-containing protein [Cyclobacteriaceae bacterium]